MKISLTAVLLLLLGTASCADDDDNYAPRCAPHERGGPYPSCVEEFINLAHAADRAGEWSVEAQCVDGEPHYWLSTGVIAVDGVEIIVDAACDTVCEIGGFRPALPCLADYDQEAWEELWRG